MVFIIRFLRAKNRSQSVLKLIIIRFHCGVFMVWTQKSITSISAGKLIAWIRLFVITKLSSWRPRRATSPLFLVARVYRCWIWDLWRNWRSGSGQWVWDSSFDCAVTSGLYPFHCAATHSRWSALGVGGVRPRASLSQWSIWPFLMASVSSRGWSVFGQDLQLVPFRRACAHSHGPVGYLLEEFCGVSNLELVKFQNTQESKSNGWVRLQNLINRRWPIFDQQN